MLCHSMLHNPWGSHMKNCNGKSEPIMNITKENNDHYILRLITVIKDTTIIEHKGLGVFERFQEIKTNEARSDYGNTNKSTFVIS